MEVNRRDFMKTAAAGALATAGVGSARAADDQGLPVRVGMTDWDLGQRGDLSKFALARTIGLDGIQVSLIFRRTATLTCAARRSRRSSKRPRSTMASRSARSRSAPRASSACRSRRTPPPPSCWSRPSTSPAASDQRYPAAGAGQQPHPHGRQEGSRHLRGHDEGSGSARGEGRRGRLARRLALRRRQHAPARRHRLRLCRRLLRSGERQGQGARPYGEIKLLGRRIHQTHVKNGKMLMRQQGGLDWPRLAQEYYDTGYRDGSCWRHTPFGRRGEGHQGQPRLRTQHLPDPRLKNGLRHSRVFKVIAIQPEDPKCRRTSGTQRRDAFCLPVDLSVANVDQPACHRVVQRSSDSIASNAWSALRPLTCSPRLLHPETDIPPQQSSAIVTLGFAQK